MIAGPKAKLLRVARGIARRVGLATAGSAPGDAFSARRAIDEPRLVEVAAVVADPTPNAGRRLVVLVPSLMRDRLTGGPNTALQLGARVAARGVVVRFVATHGGVDDPAWLATHLANLAGLSAWDVEGAVTFEAAGREANLSIRRADVVLATWWPTAHLASRTLERSGRPDFLYLIQDFEPAFYPWSTNFALALQTYSMPIRPIFNTGLLREHFVHGGFGRFAEGEGGSTWFEPAVDPTLFRRRPRPDGSPRRLLFYARPGKPRNLFDLGLRALRQAVQAGVFEGPWEFLAIGEPVPELSLGRNAVLRPMPWQSYAAYAELLGTSDVLLSLMLSPHPSYPPLEMAAGGGAVVTNTFGVKTADALRRISPRIVAVEPTADALAAALADAARLSPPEAGPPIGRPTSAGQARRPDAGRGERPTTWAAALDPVVDWILATSF